MNYKKIIIGAALTLACFSCLPVNALNLKQKQRETEAQTAAPKVYWTDNNGRVTLLPSTLRLSPVVKIALKEFAGDMKAGTGFRSRKKNRGAPIQIYQLDQLTEQGVFGCDEKARCAAASYYYRKGCFLHRYEERKAHRNQKQRPRNGLRHHETL